MEKLGKVLVIGVVFVGIVVVSNEYVFAKYYRAGPCSRGGRCSSPFLNLTRRSLSNSKKSSKSGNVYPNGQKWSNPPVKNSNDTRGNDWFEVKGKRIKQPQDPQTAVGSNIS